MCVGASNSSWYKYQTHVLVYPTTQQNKFNEFV